MKKNSKSINAKSDEKVYCFLSSKAVYIAVWNTMYLLVIYFQLLKEFQENWHGYAYLFHPQLVIVHMNLESMHLKKSDLIVGEVHM